jgi:hypothetical protein
MLSTRVTAHMRHPRFRVQWPEHHWEKGLLGLSRPYFLKEGRYAYTRNTPWTIAILSSQQLR